MHSTIIVLFYHSSGQTSSGKTYTSGLDDQTSVDDEHQGVASRALHEIFDTLDMSNSTVKISFFEIYQEKIRDLIAEHSSEPLEIAIREDSTGEIYVSGLVEKVADSTESALTYLIVHYILISRFLKLGSANRTTGGTNVSHNSSRSHAIFTISLENWVHTDSSSTKILQRSKLHLVDLAGSERLKKTGAFGLRLKESIKINSSLLVLGNVINALSDDQAQQHIPYRDSKLTRILQDSLGGNSKVTLISKYTYLRHS